MGYIAKRGTRAKPLYYAQFKDLDGRYKMRALKGARSQEEASKRLAKIEARIADGKLGFDDQTAAAGVIGIGPVIERWRDSLANRNATNDSARVNRYILPAYRNLTMGEAQQLPTAMRWLDELKAKNRKLSGQSLRHCLNLLSRFFSWAIERGYAEMNPVRMIPPGKRPMGSGKSDGPWLKDDQKVRELMSALPEPVNLMFYLGNRSGMRPGEVAGLTMTDMAFLGEGVIRVGHSYAGPLKEDRRSSGKVKWVPAAIDAEAVLGPWLARRARHGAKDEDLVFPYENGSHRPRRGEWKGFRKEYLQQLWGTARATADVRLTLHQATRHSFVSRNLEAGVPLEEVSAAIGHAQVTTTRQFYDHYVRRSFSAAIRGSGRRPEQVAPPES